MATVTNDELDIDVLKTFKYIEASKEQNIYPYPQTIQSFLMGKEKSPFYHSVFIKHDDVCGLYSNISIEGIKNSLDRLYRKGLLGIKKIKDDKILYYSIEKPKVITKTTTPKTTAIKPNIGNTEIINFYESASRDEKKILDEFKKIAKEIFPNAKPQNNKSTYGFCSIKQIEGKNGELYNPKLFWISRDKTTRKFKLHYRKTAEGSESTPLDLNTERQRTEAWRVLRVTYSTSVDEIQTIVERIKNKDDFNEYESKNVQNITLMPHQKAGVKLAEKYDRFAFFYDTGTGKTIMALDIMSNKHESKKARFLVVAPKPLIKSAWLDDSKYFSRMRLLPLSTNMTTYDYAKLYDDWRVADGEPRVFTDDDGELIEKIPNNLKEDIMGDLFKKADHFIINIDAIRVPKKGEELLKKIRVNGMIIDESVIIKNYRSQNAKRMRVFAKKMKYVYLLSGKPAPNTTIEYYSQMVIIDPKTFNITFDSFVSKYYQEVKPGRYVDINDKTRETVAKMVGNRSIIVKKEECIVLPEVVHQQRYIELDGATSRFYDDILRRFIAEIITMEGTKLVVRRMSKLGSLTKLREIASGFYLDAYDSYCLNDNKLQAIKELIGEIGCDENGKQHQVLIWCNFKHEIEELYKQLSKMGFNVVTAYADSGKNLDANIHAFKYGEADIMIANPKTLKYGVTFTSCHYCIYNSLSYSYDDYYQAHDRIYRNGQKEICFFYHLLSENTIDEIIYKCIVEKANKSKLFERLVKSASKHNIKKEDILKSLQVSEHTKDIVLEEDKEEA